MHSSSLSKLREHIQEELLRELLGTPAGSLPAASHGLLSIMTAWTSACWDSGKYACTIAGLSQSSYRAAKISPATMSACPTSYGGIGRIAAPMHQVVASHEDANAVTELRMLHVHSMHIAAWCKCDIVYTCQACPRSWLKFALVTALSSLHLQAHHMP